MGAGSIAGIHTGSRDQASSQARMTSGFTIDFAHFYSLHCGMEYSIIINRILITEPKTCGVYVYVSAQVHFCKL